MTPTPASRSATRSQPLTPLERNSRRRLIYEDALALLGLTAISICIAVLTYFFFHSFGQHRSVLEKRWYERGQQALSAGNPQSAVEDFRSALALSTANPGYELALANALAAANRNQEAYAYFSSLHEAQPGDGYLNLQLARLAVKRKDPAQAIASYQSALAGMWDGHGAEQRFLIRIELAKYLMSLGKNNEAQGDLLTAEGNSLDHPAQLFQVAELLQLAGDPLDAWAAYRRVELHSGATSALVLKSLQQEADASMAAGQYKRATQALDRYMAKARQHPGLVMPHERLVAQQQLTHLQRLMQLIPFFGLPPQQHAQRLMTAASIAHKRYANCVAKLLPQTGFSQEVSSNDAAQLSELGGQWTQIASAARKLSPGAASEQTVLTWINQTETLTAKLCGAPSGDDALLLQLTQVPDKSE